MSKTMIAAGEVPSTLRVTNKTKGSINLTVDVVSAYASCHDLHVDQLKELIVATYTRFRTLQHNVSVSAKPSTPLPAVPIELSVRRDTIVCLEDGKTFRSLKRHLHAQHGLTPEAYRVKWLLPSHYPMSAPSYVKARSRFAKQMGLGTKKKPA